MVWTKNKVLIGIFLLGLFLRLWQLPQFPYALDGDEAAFGYYGFSLSQNLSDEYLNKLPTYFSSIGDYKYPVLSYLTVIPVILFGLSEFSTRLPSVILGSLLIFVVYAISKLLTQKKLVALFAAFWIAISPYLIIFSRGAYESNIALFFTSLGILCLLLFLEKTKLKYLILSSATFLLASFSYSAAKLFLILFIPIAIIFTFKKLKQFKKLSLGLLIFVWVICLISFTDARSRARAESVSIWQDKTTQEYLRDSIHEDGLAYQGNLGTLTRVFHNKITATGLNFGKRYFDHFSPAYLFLESNQSLVKYSVSNIGLFYFLDAILIIFGLINFKNIFTKYKWLIPSWIILGVIPSSLSIETPNPIRSLVVAPALVILIAAGAYSLWQTKLFKNVLLRLAFFVIIFIQLTYFWHQYTVHDYYHQAWNTDGGIKEMVLEVNKLKSNYENVVIPDDPYIFFLFYGKVNPNYFVQNSEIQTEALGKWERVDRFENIVFKSPFDCPKIGKLNTLYVCKGEEVPLNSKVLSVIRFPDGKPAFTLIEFVPYSMRTSGTLPERVHYMVETDLSYEEGLIPQDSDKLW